MSNDESDNDKDAAYWDGYYDAMWELREQAQDSSDEKSDGSASETDSSDPESSAPRPPSPLPRPPSPRRDKYRYKYKYKYSKDIPSDDKDKLTDEKDKPSDKKDKQTDTVKACQSVSKCVYYPDSESDSDSDTYGLQRVPPGYIVHGKC